MGIGVQDTLSYSTPTLMSKLVEMGVKVKAVQTGLGTTVLLSTSGQVYTVGNNSHGQIGNPSITANFTATPTLNSYVTSIIPTLY
jgi:alpha-tubulin suppressor-like RCC1 family protein